MRPSAPMDADVVVIGSGMGGLVAAALLARLHAKRVVVLERHWRAGGFTHTFSRPGGFTWDVGVHYVGAVETPGMLRDALEIATGGALRWHRISEPFDRVVFPGIEFGFRSGRERLAEDLAAIFPDERRAIRRWLDDTRRAFTAAALPALRATAPAPVVSLAALALARRSRLAGVRTGEYLAARFRDPRLRAIAASRWVDYGLPPAQSAFLAHATIVEHYMAGAFYPVGTAATIARAAERVLAAHGGEVRLRAEVARVLVRGGRAVGVRLVSGEELSAPTVVSDAGARTTFLRLVPDDVPIPFRDALRAAPPGMGHVSVYLGLSRSPASIGLDSAQWWLHDSLDHDELWARRDRLLDGEAPHAFVSFPSMKDPAARAHTAEIVAPVSANAFARFAGTAWKRRGPEYEALKARAAEALVAAVERRLPGLRDLVVHREVSTPLTTAGFTGHAGGEIYGIPLTPERLGMTWLQPRTPIPGLYLTGADALGFGVAGAAASGLFAAAAAGGLATFREIRRIARRLAHAEPAPPAAPPSPAGAP